MLLFLTCGYLNLYLHLLIGKGLSHAEIARGLYLKLLPHEIAISQADQTE